MRSIYPNDVWVFLFFLWRFLSYHLFPAVYIKYMRLCGRGKIPKKSPALLFQVFKIKRIVFTEWFDQIKVSFFLFISQSRKDECIMEHYKCLRRIVLKEILSRKECTLTLSNLFVITIFNPPPFSKTTSRIKSKPY